jgi:glycosyltransferase involved in cell wall biosynthesis
MYSTSQWRIARQAARLCNAARGRVLYLNSFFDVHFTLLPLLAVKLFAPKTPVVLAPRGEFSTGALSLKPWKKQFYRKLLRRSGLLRKVLWQASTDDERNDIRREIGASARIAVARNMREAPQIGDGVCLRLREDALSIVFLSRIARKKNLECLIHALALARASCTLTIAGPIADSGYWSACEQLIKDTGLSGSVEYVGEMEPEDVISFVSRFDLFVLPSLGENFGHVVLESLLAGTPVVVSDQMPWRIVADHGAGLVAEIDQPQKVATAVERIAALSPAAHFEMRQRALELGQECLDNTDAFTSNVELFHSALGSQ